MSTDAIVLHKEDHQEIRKLFTDFENAGRNATKTKGKIVQRIIEALTVHTYLENEVMYPRVRALLPDLEENILESYEEHHVADLLVMELYAMAPENERFDAKTTVLIESVRHHIAEEEDELVPQGPRRPRTQRPPRHRRGDAGRQEERTPPAQPAQRPEEDHRRGHLLSDRP